MARERKITPTFNFLAFTLKLSYKNNLLHSHLPFSTKVISLCICIYPYLYKVISITLKEDICSNYFERVWRRNRMESCLSFKVWTHGFDKRDLREFLAFSFREKRVKLEVRILILHEPVEMERLLGCLSWQKSRKKWGGAWWLHGQSSLGLWVLSTCMVLWLCMFWISIGCMWNFHYNISFIICLIKTPTIYLIT